MPTKTSNTKPAAPIKGAAKTTRGIVAAPAKKSSTKPATKPVTKPAAKAIGKKTVIIARIDVGWGNSIYLRGVGGGLSWDVGVLMDNLKKDEWTWSCPAGDGPITYKFVRNDAHWALGPDHIATPGETAISVPQFPAW